jgi:protein ImuA
MNVEAQPSIIEEIRSKIQRLEGSPARARTVLPFGVEAIDSRLPGGGLAVGALHEVAGGGNGAVDGAAAAFFAAGIAARTKGKVLWVVTRQDLFAAAVAQVGLHQVAAPCCRSADISARLPRFYASIIINVGYNTSVPDW